MTDNDLIEATEQCLKDFDLRRRLGITKHDAQNLRRDRSVSMMLSFLYKAGKLKLVNGPTEQ